MTTPLGPVQRAVYAALTADTELMESVTGVYDDVPEGTAYPYVRIGEALETPDNTHGAFGRQTVLIIHVWSEYRGFAETTDIAGRVVSLLDHQPLTIAGHHHVVTKYEFGQTLDDPDRPALRHGVLRFRVLTEHEE